MDKTSLCKAAALVWFASTGSGYAGALPQQWIGNYSCQYVMGHAPGAPAPVWVFNLTVKEDESCELTWQGYQKDDDILCKVSGDSKGLKIHFISFADGRVVNSSGNQVYKSGEKLMELKPIVGDRKIWTKWWALNKVNVLRDGVRFARD